MLAEKMRPLARCRTSGSPQVEEEWVHTIMSESSDDERTYSDQEERYPLGGEDEYPTVERQFYRDLYRRAFVLTDEKYRKVTRQNKLTVELSFLLHGTKDVTHESNPEDIYLKLKREGSLDFRIPEGTSHINIHMPKKVALPIIRGVIGTKANLHGIDEKCKLVKKLVTLVPCIKAEIAETDSDLVAKFLHKTGLSCGFSEHAISSAISNFRHILVGFEDQDNFHPVIRKERIKDLLAHVKRYHEEERCRYIKRLKSYREAPEYLKYLKREEKKFHSAKVYQDSLRVVQLHQEFHKHVASCNFINHNMRSNDLLKDKRVVKTRFETLDKSLILKTLKMRLDLLREMDEFSRYEAWLNRLLVEKDRLGRSRMDEILDTIRANNPTFPQLSNKWTFVGLKNVPLHWTDDQQQEEMSSFYEFLDMIKDHTSCPVSYGYLMEGVLIYSDFRSWMEREPRELEPRELVQDEEGPLTIFDPVVAFKNKTWDEAFYMDSSYKVVYEDMSRVFC